MEKTPIKKITLLTGNGPCGKSYLARLAYRKSDTLYLHGWHRNLKIQSLSPDLVSEKERLIIDELSLKNLCMLLDSEFFLSGEFPISPKKRCPFFWRPSEIIITSDVSTDHPKLKHRLSAPEVSDRIMIIRPQILNPTSTKSFNL